VRYDRANLDLNHRDLHFYTTLPGSFKPRPVSLVVDVSKILYTLNPPWVAPIAKPVRNYKAINNHNHRNKESCMGVIARAILHTGVHVFRSVVPVRIGHGLHQPTERDKNTYGLLVTLVSGLHTIVFVDLLCIGFQSGISAWKEDTSHLRLWTKRRSTSTTT
jgi:hypothetical protein